MAAGNPASGNHTTTSAGQVFQVSTFDPRYQDDPASWLGDLGLFGIDGALAQPFATGAVGLQRSDDPRDMAAGVKISGEAGAWGIDMLGIQSVHGDDADPQDAFVARLARKLSDGLRLGLIVTSGDPDEDVDANTLGVDMQYRSGGALEGRAWLQRTRKALPSDSGGRDGDDRAWGLNLRYPRGRHVVDAWYQHFGDAFDPALGFVSKPGVDDANVQYRYRHRPGPGDAWRVGHGLAVRDVRAIDSDEASGSLSLTLLEMQSGAGDNWSLFASQRREVLANGYDLVERLPVSAGKYEYSRYGLGYDTRRFDDWVLGFQFIRGGYLDGTREDFRVSGNWEAADWLRMNAEYAVADHEQPTGAFTARTLALRSTLALAAGWSFSPLVQFNNVNDQLGMKARLRWHAGQGQELFLVWNRTLLRDLEDRFVTPLQDSVLKGLYRIRF